MSDSQVALRLASGGPAAIVENSGDHVTLRSSKASPPGSTLALEHAGLALQIKVRGCKRVDDSEMPFRIEGRFVSLTRAAREQLFGIKTENI
ncbi:MAG TPA: hypothetical protein VHV51_05300 [Polyangiaceae bacterium]|jgi:hypothetical protein|nr:hypothetical protein [Polyangiaceae bacterium]